VHPVPANLFLSGFCLSLSGPKLRSSQLQILNITLGFENLPAGKFRHRDHRFEWTKAEFQTWAKGVAERFGCGVEFRCVGTEDLEVGSPTQMAIFTQQV
jgi:hypothetical protein